MIVKVHFKHSQQRLGRDDLLVKFDFPHSDSIHGNRTATLVSFNLQGATDGPAVMEAEGKRAVTMTGYHF